MAKKTTTDLGDDDFDDFDFSGDDFSFEPPPDNRKPITKLGTSFLEGVKETALNGTLVKGIVRKAIPKEYDSTIALADDAVGLGSDLYNSAVKDIKPVIKDLQRSAKSVLPTVNKFLPNSLSKRLEAFLTDNDERRRQDELNTDESTISLELGNIFKAQLAQQAQATAQAGAEAVVRDVERGKQVETSISQVQSIRKGMDRLVGYQDQVATQFQRKSLELQYRQFFVLRDTLELHKANSVDVQKSLAAIAVNTGLPEANKIQLAEAGTQAIRDKMFEGAASSFADFSSGFRRKFGNNLKSAVKSKVGDFTEAMRGAMDTAESLQMLSEMQASMGGGQGITEMAGNMAGGSATSWLGNKAGGFIGGILNKNDKVKQTGYRAMHAANNLTDTARSFSKSERFDDTPIIGGLLRFLKDAMPQFSLDDDMSSKYQDNLENPTNFTMQTQKSIVEIIPGFLSRILQELQITRTGDTSIERVIFNHDKDAFTTRSAAAKSLIDRNFGSNDRSSTMAQLDKVFEQLDPTGKKLSPQAREEFKSQLLSDAMNGRGFYGDKYGNSNNLDKVSEGNRSQVTDLMKELFSMDENGKAGSVGQEALHTKIGSSFKRVMNGLDNPRKALTRDADVGYRDLMSELGLLTDTEQGDKLNYDAIQDIILGRGPSLGGSNNEGGMAANGRRTKGGNNRRRNAGNFGLVPFYGNGQGSPSSGQAPAPNNLESVIRDSNESLINAIRENSTLAETQRGNSLLEGIYALLEIGGPGVGQGNGPLTYSGLFKQGIGAVGRGIGKVGSIVGGFYSKVFGAAGSAISGAGDLIKSGFGWASKKVDSFGFSDIYVRGKAKGLAALTAAKLTSGDYIDELTGNVIKKYSDITGPVRDKVLDQLAITVDDFKAGFYDKEGKSVIRVTFEKVMSAYGSMFTPVKAAFGLVTTVITKFTSWIKEERDIYVHGEENPRILAIVLQAGGYRSKRTGKTLYSWRDIDGDVIDADDKVILSVADMRKGLVNAAGEKIKGLTTKAFELAADIMKTPIRLAKGLWSAGKRIVKAGLGAAGGFLDRMAEGGASMTQVAILSDIRKILDSRLPGKKGKFKGDSDQDGDRDGSWQDRAAKKVKAAKDLLIAKKKGLLTPGMSAAAAGAMAAGNSMAEAISGKISGITDSITDSIQEKIGGTIGDKLGEYGDRAKGKLGDLTGRGRASVRRGAGRVGRGLFGRATLDAAGNVVGKGGILRQGASLAGRGLMGAGSLVGRGALAAATMLPMSGLMTAATSVAGAVGTVAGGIGTAVGAIGSGLGAAAGAVGAMLSAPVVLGALAVAAVGVGAYYGYKYLTRDKPPLTRFRYTEYGIDCDDEDDVELIAWLESKFLTAVGYQDGVAKFIGKNVPLVEILDKFDIDQDDVDDTKYWLTWFTKRFKPVYLKHMTILKDLAPAIKLAEIDAKMPQKLKLTFINRVKFDFNDPKSPYAIEEGPFDDECDCDAEDVEDQYNESVEAIKKADEKAASDPKSAEALSNATVTGAALLAKGAASGGGGGGPSTIEKAATLTLIAGGVKGLEKAKPAGALMLVAGNSLPANTIFATTLDALTCVRAKTYGLVTLDVEKVKALLHLEEALEQSIVYNAAGQATFDGDAREVMQSFAGQFGLSTSDGVRVADWLVWFSLRFLPVYLTYATAVHTIDPGVKLFQVMRKLKPEQIQIIATAVICANAMLNETSVSVWTIDKAAFNGQAVNRDVATTNGNMQAIKDANKRKTFEETTVKIPGSDENGTVKTAPIPLGGSATADFAKNPSMLAGYASKNNVPPGGGMLQRMGAGTFSANDMLKGVGAIHPGNGTGGDINSIPMPKGDGNYLAMKDMINAAAAMVGVDPTLMSTMASIESNFRAVASPGTSKAAGLYQFIPTTWTDMLNRFGGKYGISKNTSPNDPRANALMGAEFLKENQQKLEKALGRPVTDTDLYAAHFMGPQGAIDLLRSDPNAIAAQLHPNAAASNKEIFFTGLKGSGPPRTIAEVYAVLDGKVRVHSKAIGKAGGGGTLMLANSAAPSGATASAPTALTTATASTPGFPGPAPATPTAPAGGGTVGIMAAPKLTGDPELDATNAEIAKLEGSAAYQATLDPSKRGQPGTGAATLTGLTSTSAPKGFSMLPGGAGANLTPEQRVQADLDAMAKSTAETQAIADARRTGIPRSTPNMPLSLAPVSGGGAMTATALTTFTGPDISKPPVPMQNAVNDGAAVIEQQRLATQVANASTVQSSAVNNNINSGVDSVLGVLQQSFEIQRRMEAHLKIISDNIQNISPKGNAVPTTVAATPPIIAGPRSTAATAKQAPISMRSAQS